MTLADTPAPSSDAWWREWFNDIYLDVYAHRDDASAEREVSATVEALELEPSARVLDLCCGAGRHSRAFLKQGFERVVGIDYSYPLLRFGMSERPRACFVRGDMRLLPLLESSLDAAAMFFTSFGYFKTNIENLSVLHELNRVLRPGGRFLIDYLNPDHVRETFQPESERRHGEYCIRERRWFSDDGERIEKEIRIDNWGGRNRVFVESVRLYSHDDIRDMLANAELQVDGTLGSFEGEAFSASSPRMIVYGRKA